LATFRLWGTILGKHSQF